MPALKDGLLTQLAFCIPRRLLSGICGVAIFSSLSGCVTETRYANNNKPVVQKKTNNQDAAKTRIALALQYLNTGNNTQAKYNLDRALTLAPKLPESHYALAYYFEQVGEDEKAQTAYVSALTYGPNDPNTRNNYGAFLCRIGDYDAATEQFFKAIDIPSYLRVAESYENLALCALRQDNFDLALDYLKRALDHNSQRQSVLILMASVFYAKSELHRAEDVLKVYANKGFVSARGMLLEHLLSARMGRLQYAQELEALLLQTYPSSVEARLVLNNTLDLSEFEQLKEQYRTAQLNKITQLDDNHVVANPQIKIKRKVPAPVADKAQNQPKERYSATTLPTRSLLTKTRGEAPQTTETQHRTTTVTELVSPEAQAFTSGSRSVSTVPSREATKLDENVVKKATEEPKVRFSTTTKKSAGSEQVVFHRVDPSKITFSQEPQVRYAEPDSSGRLLNEEVLLPKVPTHRIELGENLFSVSVKYNIKLEKLLKWNALKKSDRVSVDQVVYLNDPNTTHAIVKGESLFDIAMKHKLLIDDLMRWNRLTPDVALTPGRRILIVDPNNYIL
ncbi:type IV pilus biogenesis/stability protein PilW [Pseudoalteromonas luteoviolacea]|uniref:type IV pilus biogenesis/stability protein PilW n=1 Tax=Pseudoalteromonas luteoviolacea TaxID=43657 RepID=UPI001EEF7141|nr:type IV pilus biogenesis/stability protein PilW [Pseudoalteromonas luteoviolacea]MCF6441481.1 type IV pilus biogenesis/stability protein PilW [Pseudoalteromonas luteoviolacea]